MSGNERLRKYILAAEKGASWLAAQQNDDGSVLPEWGVGSVYKTLIAFINTGHWREAHLLLNWTKENLMMAPGEFHAENEGAFETYQTLYRNAYVVIGALKLGRFDVASEAALRRVLEYQDDSGGFFPTMPEDGEGRLQPHWAAMGGWTALYFGRYVEARRAGDFIAKVIDLQPEPEDKLFFVYDTRTGGLITNPPPGDAVGYRVDAKDPEQRFFQAGISAAFLSDLCSATQDARYLHYAEKYMSFSLRCSDPRSFRWPSKCKDGWGAAAVYSLTRNPKYLELAQKVADITFLESQHENGSWDDWVPPFPDLGTGVRIPGVELTAEFTFQLMEVVKGLSC